MTDFDPVLHQQGNSGKGGRPSFGHALLRLYRNDVVWRGAVDLSVIGTLIMVLTWGFPDIFDGLDKIAQTQAPGPSPSSILNSPSSSGSTPPAANFAPAASSPKINQLVPPSLPRPPKPQGGIPKVWIGTVSPEDKKILDNAADHISDHGGINNQSIIASLKDKAEKGEMNFQFMTGVAIFAEATAKKSSEGMEKTIYWYKEAAVQGHPLAQFELGQIYKLGNLPGIHTDMAEAVKWYEMAKANPLNDSGKAENELGLLYMNGVYFPQSEDKALENFKLAAAKGEENAQANLGAHYYNMRDYKSAKEWIEKAAISGSKAAQHNLAQMHFRAHIGDSIDYGQFLKWAGLAADQGFVPAMLSLGDFYREGAPGFEVDNRMAAKYYRLAALKKDPKAQFLFGEMYEQGLGIPEDKIQAYLYYSLSYKNGYAPAYNSLSLLKGKMSPADLDYGEKMVRALTPKGQ